MRTKTSNWFEVKVCFEKQFEDGSLRKVNESYVVEAESFTEAEAMAYGEFRSYASGEFKVVNINPMKFHEVVFGDADAELFFKAKLLFITVDEKTEKEKKSPVVYLVQASSFDDCKKNISKLMEGTMIDYQVSAVLETKIMGVVEHKEQGPCAA